MENLFGARSTVRTAGGVPSSRPDTILDDTASGTNGPLCTACTLFLTWKSSPKSAGGTVLISAHRGALALRHPVPGRAGDSFDLSSRRRENHSFAQPKRFAHNGLVEVRVLPAHNSLVGGLSPSSPTTQSCATGDFLKVHERSRIGGDLLSGL